MLLPLGFVLREAASGSEALESVRSELPDAVLLDISMDDMDGWATAKALRAAGFADVPIIMVSANVFENRPENLAAAGCQAFVGKPVMESELLRALGTCLNLSWATRQANDAAAQALPGVLPAPRARQPVAPSMAETVSDPLPADAAWELNRLACKGHVQALRASLSDWRGSHPAHELHWARVEAWLEQFDLDAIATYAASYLEEDAIDDPTA
jgi:CheY-like chemotaxis protein